MSDVGSLLFAQADEDVVFLPLFTELAGAIAADHGLERSGDVGSVDAQRRGFGAVDGDEHLGHAFAAADLGVGYSGHGFHDVLDPFGEVAGDLHVVAADFDRDALADALSRPHPAHHRVVAAGPHPHHHSGLKVDLGPERVDHLLARSFALGFALQLHCELGGVRSRAGHEPSSADLDQDVLHLGDLAFDDGLDSSGYIVGDLDLRPRRQFHVDSQFVLVGFGHHLDADERDQTHASGEKQNGAEDDRLAMVERPADGALVTIIQPIERASADANYSGHPRMSLGVGRADSQIFRAEHWNQRQTYHQREDLREADNVGELLEHDAAHPAQKNQRQEDRH